MPEAPLDARAEITLLRDAIHASHEQGSHLHHVFSGWEECAPCEKANEEGDGTFACDAYKAWQKETEAGHRSRAEVAVDQLVAALTDSLAKLEIAERQARDLDAQLAERDEQIAGLLADEISLTDDQPGVPA